MAAIEKEFKDEEEKANLLRSHRFMDFTDKEINEYVSSDEEEEKAQDKLLVQDVICDDESESGQESGGRVNDFNVRSRSMIFKPFRPGKAHDALRQIPQSV